MIIETLALGKLDVQNEQIYQFPKGIPGFDDENEFAMITLEEGPFSYLQSLKDTRISFLISDPFVFYPAYEFELPESDAEELGITESVIVRCIVTINEQTQIDLTTINLLAPIVLNPLNKQGKQVVLHNSPYRTKHLLWPDKSEVTEKDGD